MSVKRKDNHLLCAKHLLSKLKLQECFCFSLVRKNFDQNERVNQRHDRDHKDIPIVIHTNLILGVMGNEVDVMPPHFFPHCLRVKAADYKEVLKMVVMPWIESISKRRLYSYHQISMLYLKAKTIQEWMSYNIYDHVTPKHMSSCLFNHR